MKTIYSRFFKLILVILTTQMIFACGGGGGSSSIDNETPIVADLGWQSYAPDTCSDANQLKFIYDVMHDIYFWSEYTPDLDYSTYTSQDDLIESLRYGSDKWSYITTQQEYLDHYAGANTGLGIKMTYSSVTNEIFITTVYPDSPADSAGLMRGFEITSVNGNTAQDIIQNSLWTTAFEPSAAGSVTNISYIDNNSQAGAVSITTAAYYAHSVPAYEVFTNSSNGKKIGYLMYLSFTSKYASDLFNALSSFETNNISELIVDLRYNGGGQNRAAEYLASVIGGSPLVSKVMYYYLHNSRYASWDSAEVFSSTTYNLNIEKVVFITTQGTASASELVINSLSPYIPTTLVGSTTHGKPVGMYAISFCDKYLVPISFQLLNSELAGDYFDGMDTDCSASDDVTHQLGDADEEMLATAISYLETGTCAKSKASHSDLKEPVRKGIYNIFNVQ